jgi:hypothetical protein
MNRKLAMVGLLFAAGCSSSSSPGGASGDDGSASDAMQGSDSTMMPEEAGNPDAGGPDTGTSDGGPGDAMMDSTMVSDASDGGGPDADAATDASADAPCTGEWLVAPTVAALPLPDAGVVVLHASGAGTQDYACIGTPIDAGADAGDAGESFAWTLTGPDAVLSDCHGDTLGHHFASEAGASAPEWQTTDGTYVIGHKLASYTPDGGAASVPWLLLQAASQGGSGVLSTVTYIQRLDTDGGVAPATGCDVDASGATTTVPYTADYYFFAP